MDDVGRTMQRFSVSTRSQVETGSRTRNARRPAASTPFAGALMVAFVAVAGVMAQTPAAPPAAPQALPEDVTATNPIVAEVRVEGNERVAEERIRSHCRTYPGRAYDQFAVREDVRRLFATNKFYSVHADETETPQGVVVTYHVIERPVIEKVEFLGDFDRKGFPFGKADLRHIQEITDLRAGKPMDPGLNRALGKRVEEYFHGKGYPFATAELVEGGEREDRNVVMKITKGPKTKVRSVAVEGNEFIGADRLKMVNIHSRPYVPFVSALAKNYDPAVIEQDLQRLVEYYRENGFLDVRVGRKVEWTEDRSAVRLTFLIEEGPRYKINDVHFAGVDKLPETDLDTNLQLTSGNFFNGNKLERDLRVIQDEYGKRGYINTMVQPDVRYREQPGEIDIVYKVREDVPRRIRNIRVVGNEITKRDVIISRMDGVRPGEIVSTPEVRRAEAQLAGSRLFEVDPARNVRPTIEFDEVDPNSDFVDLSVIVEEAQTGSLLLGAGVNSDSGIGGSLVLNERNFDLFAFPRSFDDIGRRAFRGAGQEFRLEIVPGTEVQRYTVTFREPQLLGLNYSFSSSGYYYRRLFSAYDEERAGGRFTLGKRFTRNIGAALTWRVENIGVSDIRSLAPDFQEVEGDNFITSLKLTVDHDTRDSHLSPSSGHLVTLGYEQAFGDFEFPKFTGEAIQFWTVRQRADGSGKHVLSLKGEAGFTGSDTPLFDRFYAGGFQSIRGFDFRGVGPVVEGTEVGGDFLMLSSIEYQLPLTADDGIGMVFFCDAGTVEQDLEIRDYRVAPGLGLRLKVPGMGPVPFAFDFAWPVVDSDQDDRRVFSFFLGIFR